MRNRETGERRGEVGSGKIYRNGGKRPGEGNGG